MPRPARLLPLALLLLASAPVAAPAQSSAGLTAHADRWQVLLNSGSYLYDVHLVRASGDTLVVTRNDTVPAGALALPLADVDELRLIQASVKTVGHGARGTFAGLAGADDAVYKLSRFDPDERRRIVARIFSERAGQPSPAP
ncbi:MAG: hypothetical protein ACJ79S_10750 [Gemmatimonadaceae bacterium]